MKLTPDMKRAMQNLRLAASRIQCNTSVDTRCMVDANTIEFVFEEFGMGRTLKQLDSIIRFCDDSTAEKRDVIRFAKHLKHVINLGD